MQEMRGNRRGNPRARTHDMLPETGAPGQAVYNGPWVRIQQEREGQGSEERTGRAAKDERSRR